MDSPILTDPSETHRLHEDELERLEQLAIATAALIEHADALESRAFVDAERRAAA
jgi:hypothetical protein